MTKAKNDEPGEVAHDQIEHQRGRVTHETDTKLHENDTGFTWFVHGFSRLQDAQPPLTSALAPPRKSCFPNCAHFIRVHPRPSAVPSLLSWIYETNPPALSSPSSTVLIGSTTCSRRNINCRFSAPTSGDVLENSCVSPWASRIRIPSLGQNAPPPTPSSVYGVSAGSSKNTS